MPQLTPARKNHTVSAVILAAGKGTRMKSTSPKVLHHVLGRSMLDWVLDVVKKAGATEVTVVLSPETKAFSDLLTRHPDVRVAIQTAQKGTGDAVAAAARAYSKSVVPAWSAGQLLRGKPSDSEWILICAGDTPGINPQTIREFISASLQSNKKLAVLGMNVREPRGYGRIVTSADGGVKNITEERDADSETKKITLCNSGIIFAEISWLFKLLESLSPNNSQNEYYLTDVFMASAKLGHSAFIYQTEAENEFAGVNDRMQLAQMEHSMLRKRIHELMMHGVTFHLPDTVYIDADVTIEPDATIYPGACLVGKTHIARNCIIGHGAYLENTVLGADVDVGAHAVLIGSRIKCGEIISPQSSHSNLQL